MTLEEEFNQYVLGLHRRTGQATGYWPNYFLAEVRKQGGLATAKGLLAPGSVSSGFDRLVKARRLDLSIEAIALRPRFQPLFTKGELEVARARLSEFSTAAWPRSVDTPYPEEISGAETFPEGTVSRVLVNRYERDARARRACLKYHGHRCVVCDLDFAERYGELGAGFIHVHHVRPLSGPGAVQRVDPKRDLVPICPNCHAMVHRTDPAMDVVDLRALIRPR